MTEDASELVRLHAEAKTHRGKAELETRLRRAMGIRLREVNLLLEGSSMYEIQKRSTLVSAASEEAWRLLDEERVTLASVCAMLKDAEVEAKRTKEDVDSVLRRFYENALSRGLFRRESSGYLGLIRGRQEERDEEVDEWQGMKTAVRSLVSRELKELDAIERDEMMLDLGVELDILVRQYKARIRSRAKNGLREGWNERTERRKLFDALREIGVDPPRPGKLPDMDEVRRVYRRAAADSHPDRHPGNDHMAKKFARVNDAYQAVLAYVNSLSE